MRKDTFNSARLGLSFLGFALLAAMAWLLFIPTEDHHEHSTPSPTLGVVVPESASAIQIDSVRRSPLLVPTVPDSWLADEDSLEVNIKVTSSENGAPISDATVSYVGSEDTSLLGYSDADGLCSVRLQLSVVSTLQAAKIGFASKDFWVEPETVDGAIPVVLPVASVLSGVVLMPDGNTAPANTAVIAWPRGSVSPNRGQILGWMNGRNSTITGAWTDDIGGFYIPGIDSSQSYRVLAARPGYCSELVKATAGESAEIELDSLFGSLVRLRDDSGTVPKLTLPRSAVVSKVPPGAGLDWMDGREPFLALCGVPSIDDIVQTPFDFLLLFRSQSTAAQNPEVSTRISLPGFQTVSMKVELKHVLGEIPAWDCKLETTNGVGRGTIQFEFEGYYSPLQPNSLLSPAVLTLMAKASEARLEFDVPSLSRPLVLEGIPLGEYEYSFRPIVRVSFPDHRLPDLRGSLTLSTGEETAAINLSQAGAIEVRVFRSTGQLDGRFRSFRLVPNENPSGWTDATVWKGVRLLELIPPGTYSLTPEKGFQWGDSVEAALNIRVFPGEVAKVDVMLSDGAR